MGAIVAPLVVVLGERVPFEVFGASGIICDRGWGRPLALRTRRQAPAEGDGSSGPRASSGRGLRPRQGPAACVPAAAVWGGGAPSIGGGITTADRVICPGSKGLFVPVLEPGFGCRDKRLEAFCPGW